jgi:hypothetical protein
VIAKSVRDKGDTMEITSSDRVAAALLRIDYAEEILKQARKILEYEEKQDKRDYIEEPDLCEE